MIRLTLIALALGIRLALVVGGVTGTLPYVLLGVTVYVVTIFIAAVSITLRKAWVRRLPNPS